MKRKIWLVGLFILATIAFFPAKKLYKRKLDRPYLTVIGFANMADGIGRQTVEIIDSMKNYMSVGFYPTQSSNLEDVPNHVRKIMSKTKRPFGKVILYEDIFYKTSHEFFHKKFSSISKGTIKIAYSMCESTKLHEYWVHNLNLYFDAVVVPDEFLVEAYKSSGVTIPIFVIPLGLNLKPLLSQPIKNTKHSPFVFASFGSCILRKNHDLLIEAFAKAFGNNPHVVLWINARYAKGGLAGQLKAQIKDLGVDNIIFTGLPFNSERYICNLMQVDAYVNISQAEGFSIQPREAMALGIPCIVSDNTAQSVICQTGLVRPVPCLVKEPAYYELFQDVVGYRYSPTLESTVSALLDVYNHYDNYLAHAAESRKWAANYDYSNIYPLYRTLLKPKEIKLGSENKMEGDILITNSVDLYNKYKNIL